MRVGASSRFGPGDFQQFTGFRRNVKRVVHERNGLAGRRVFALPHGRTAARILASWGTVTHNALRTIDRREAPAFVDSRAARRPSLEVMTDV